MILPRLFSPCIFNKIETISSDTASLIPLWLCSLFLAMSLVSFENLAFHSYALFLHVVAVSLHNRWVLVMRCVQFLLLLTLPPQTSLNIFVSSGHCVICFPSTVFKGGYFFLRASLRYNQHIINVYKLVSFDICVHTGNHHHESRQGTHAPAGGSVVIPYSKSWARFPWVRFLVGACTGGN